MNFSFFDCKKISQHIITQPDLADSAVDFVCTGQSTLSALRVSPSMLCTDIPVVSLRKTPVVTTNNELNLHVKDEL